MRTSSIITLIFVLVFAAYVAVELHFRSGKILAESHNGWSTVKIREIHTFPILGWPLVVLDDNPQYRFEYYSNSPPLWSCQSYRGKSFTATSASIKWTADGTASAFLEDILKFTCKDGQWKELGHH